MRNRRAQSRVVTMSGVKGLIVNSVAAHPSLGIGNTTGEAYIRNCMSRGSARPTSV